VEVDASKDIISEVEVRLPTGEVYQQLVIPELKPKFCKRCKTFGHVEGGCGKGPEGTNSKVFDDRKTRTGGGGPLEGVTGIDKGTDAEMVVPLPDNGPKVIKDWLMSGPKAVRDAVLPSEGPIHSQAAVMAVMSAIALAMGRILQYSDKLTGNVGGPDEPETDKDCSSDEGSAEPDVTPMEPAETDVVVSGQLVAGQREEVAVQQQSVGESVGLGAVGNSAVGLQDSELAAGPAPPEGGLDVDSVGWKTVGKKGRRKKK